MTSKLVGCERLEKMIEWRGLYGAEYNCVVPAGELASMATELLDGRKVGGGMKRMWIDQPSSLQPLHHLHGINVISMPFDHNGFTYIYFLSGDVVSMRAHRLWLSAGWRDMI